MPINIVVTGEPPDSDIELFASAFKKAAGSDNAIITVCSIADIDSILHADAYFSYSPCTPDLVRLQFSCMPLGAGEQTPFFQKIEKDANPDFLGDYPVYGIFQSPLSNVSAAMLAGSVFQNRRCMEQNRTLMGEVVKYRKQNSELIRIGTALSMQNDLRSLLDMILAGSRELSDADAGSIYIRERSGPGKHFTEKLLFMISQNDSIDVTAKSRSFVVDINKNTIAGYVAFTGETLNIEDVYEISESCPYMFGRNFEKEFGYRVKSMLTVPLKNLSGEVVGVIQLMNKRDDKPGAPKASVASGAGVIPFAFSDEDIVRSIASLAAVSIERVQLYEDIQQLFEGFLDSSIAAVDERDRVTSGHSRRVMGYALAFVDAVNADRQGVFKDMFFDDARKRQFKFAALLHDIGKIGVPENLLNKETRIHEGRFSALLARFDMARCAADSKAADPQLTAWAASGKLDEDRAFVEKVNKSGFLSDSDLTNLSRIRAISFSGYAGRRFQLVTDEEWKALSIRKGNLTDEERNLINSHAVSTRRILSKIPWTRELENIPDIAAHHHEKMDGSGYPDKLKGSETSFESRILAVVDIYEALVAQDRPYKPAMAPERAIGILREEVKNNRLDGAIVEFFVEKNIHRIYSSHPAAVPE